MSNSSPPIDEFPLYALFVFYKILLSLCNPNLYPIFRTTDTFYKWNLPVIRTKDFSPWYSDWRGELYLQRIVSITMSCIRDPMQTLSIHVTNAFNIFSANITRALFKCKLLYIFQNTFKDLILFSSFEIKAHILAPSNLSE